MRKIIITGMAVLLLLGAGVGWWGYKRYILNPLDVARALVAKGQYQAAALELRDMVRRHPDNASAHARLGALQLVIGEPLAAAKEFDAARAAGYKGSDLLPLIARATLALNKPNEVLHDFVPDGLPPADAASLLVTRGLAQLAAGDAEAARSDAEAAEHLAPTAADAPLLAARAALMQGQPGWALDRLDAAIRLNPKMTEALLTKAGVLRAEGRLADSIPVLDTAVTVAPNAANVRLARANALIALNRDSEARTDLAAVLATDGRNPLANYLNALLAVRMRDWHSADIALQAIQPLLPRLPRGEYYLALVKENIAQMEQATEAIRHYTARVPGDPDGWRLLARIELMQGRKDDAMAALARLAGATDPTQAPVEIDNAALPKVEALADTPQQLTHLASVQLGQGDAAAAGHDLERSLELLPSPADAAAAEAMSALRVGDIDRASAALETLKRQPKVDPERLAVLSGAVRVALLDIDGARAAFEDGLKQVPDSLSLKVNLARVLALLGHEKEAEALLLPVLDKSPALPAPLATMVDILAAGGQPARAMELLNKARAAQPQNLALLVAAASLQARMGDGPGAIVTLDSATADQTRSPRLLAVRARLLLAQNKVREAADTYGQLLRLAPDNLGIRRQYIDLLLATGQNDAAVTAAADGLKRTPGNSSMLQAEVTATYRASGLDAALARADALRHDPINLPAARLLKGAVYMVAGRPADAAAADAAEAREAPFGALVVAEANAQNVAGQPDAARATLTAWTKTQPDPVASDVLGALDIEAKNFDEAETALVDVLAARPGDPVALNNLAWVYQQKHDSRALPLARRAYLLAPGGQTADTLGWILVQENEAPTGLLLLRQAAARLPTDPSVHYHLAVALEHTGQREPAASLLKLLIDKGGNFPERDAAVQLAQRIAAGTP